MKEKKKKQKLQEEVAWETTPMFDYNKFYTPVLLFYIPLCKMWKKLCFWSALFSVSEIFGQLCSPKEIFGLSFLFYSKQITEHLEGYLAHKLITKVI